MVLPTSPHYTRVTIQTARGSRKMYDGGKRIFQPQDSVADLLRQGSFQPIQERIYSLRNNSSSQMQAALQPHRLRIPCTPVDQKTQEVWTEISRDRSKKPSSAL